MAADAAQGPGMTWLMFALMTVACWGVYGILLHTGQVAMNGETTRRSRTLRMKVSEVPLGIDLCFVAEAKAEAKVDA